MENLDKLTIERFWFEKSKSTTTRWTNPSMLEYEIEALLELIPPSPLEILDLGCGFGELSSSLIRGSLDFVTGVDFERYSPSKYDSLPNAKFVHSPLQSYNTDNKFDLVLLFGVITYLNLDEELAIYEKVRTLLRTNGLFIVKNQCALDNEIVVNAFSKKLAVDYSGRYPQLEEQRDRLSTIFKSVSVISYPDSLQEHKDTKHFMFVCQS